MITVLSTFRSSMMSPLIDPFLLFNGENPQYQELHESILKYLRFLRDHASKKQIHWGYCRTGFTFPRLNKLGLVIA